MERKKNDTNRFLKLLLAAVVVVVSPVLTRHRVSAVSVVMCVCSLLTVKRRLCVFGATRTIYSSIKPKESKKGKKKTQKRWILISHQTSNNPKHFTVMSL